jgi:citrate lyase beta subunit
MDAIAEQGVLNAEEIAEARESMQIYRRSEAEGVGAFGPDGKLVDAAHMRHAENVLYRASIRTESDRPMADRIQKPRLNSASITRQQLHSGRLN